MVTARKIENVKNGRISFLLCRRTNEICILLIKLATAAASLIFFFQKYVVPVSQFSNARKTVARIQF